MNKTLVFPIVAMTFIFPWMGASASPSQAASATTADQETWPEIEPNVKDLAYAEKSPAEKLDLYLPAKNSAPAPLVIWIHGGAFTLGDKRSMPRRDFGPPPPPRGPYGISQIQVPNVAA